MMRNVSPYPNVPQVPNGSMFEVPVCFLACWKRVFLRQRDIANLNLIVGLILSVFLSQSWKLRRVDLG